jgi:hypothetical protein
MHSYMMGLYFVMEPPFECPGGDARDVAFIKAMRTIGGCDDVEEYMACGLFPLLASFGFGEIATGEMPVSEFPIVRLPDEMNDGFRGRVEVDVVNVVGKYAREEHDTCIAVFRNEGRVNRVFEQAGVPYEPRLEPKSEASKETALKHESDAGAGPTEKRAKVSGRKTVPSKELVVPIGVGAASSKAAPTKAATSTKLTHAKSTLKASVASGAGTLPKVGAPSGATVSKITATVTASRAGVLKISTGTKRPATASSPTAKGK